MYMFRYIKDGTMTDKHSIAEAGVNDAIYQGSFARPKKEWR